MSEPVHGAPFVRSRVLASAGSGKTYRLPTLLLDLLKAGVPPDEILASTFTRKAAAEIRERVLLRLADEVLAAPGERLPADLLASTADSLHRFRIQTLDSFFIQVATVFGAELGFPPDWRPADDLEEERISVRALEEVLAESLDDIRLRLPALLRGEAGQGVHRTLLRVVREAHRLHRSIDPEVVSPWGFSHSGEWEEIDPSRWGLLADRMAAAWEEQRDLLGTAPESWRTAFEKAEAALRSGDPVSAIGSGPFAAVVKGAREGEPPTYRRKPLCDSVVALGEEVLALIPSFAGPSLQRRMEALGDFLPRYDRALRRIREGSGRYGFDDVTQALALAGSSLTPGLLHYRLDARIRHLLLDEFQDTSALQWRALLPIVSELLSGYAGERAFFVVGDPKQSIYGWRGGDPRILMGMGEEDGLVEEVLDRSWRSSPVILDFVNDLFGGIGDRPPFGPQGRAADCRAVREWSEGFTPHRAVREELPGHVTIRSGPEEPRTSVRMGLLRETADAIVTLHEAAPDRTIGVLTRSNRVAGVILRELRNRGVEASEEGGVRVADSPWVIALLALLRWMDHPGDTLAGHLVEHSPFGEEAGAGEGAGPAEREARAHLLRRRLSRLGYGRFVREVVERVEAGVPPPDLRRLRQVVDLAYAWEPRATPRIVDFVRWIELARREDPRSAAIRVMTIHRAKGLEFDAVFLPDLGESAGGGGGPDGIPVEGGLGGAIVRVLPRVSRDLAPFFPEVEEALEVEREGRMRDMLSLLYVGTTRARHALHILLAPDGASATTATSPARMVREAVRVHASGNPDAFDGKGRLLPDRELFRAGDPRWHSELPPHPVRRFDGDAVPAGAIRLAPPRGDRHLLHARPSELHLERERQVSELLRPRSAGGMRRGERLHRELEGIEWMDPDVESTPSDPQDAAVLRAEPIRDLLLRDRWPAGTRVLRERRFLLRIDDRIVTGSVDRLHLVPPEGGEDARAVVIDWKTDHPPADPPGAAGLELLVERHRPQIEAYLEAVASLHGLPPDRVEGRLAFLSLGTVVRITLPVAARGIRP